MNRKRVAPSRSGFSRPPLHPMPRAILTLFSVFITIFLVGIGLSATSQPLYAAPPSPTDDTMPAVMIQQLQAQSQGAVTVTVHPTFGTVRMVQVSPGGDLLSSVAIASQRDATLTAKAEQFFADYGQLFGLNGEGTALTLTAQKADSYGFTDLTYQEAYRGVPIFGGYIRAHFDRQGRLTAVNGVALAAAQLAKAKLNPTPTLTADEAGTTALTLLATTITTTAELRATDTSLYIYQTGLVQGVPGLLHLAYRVEVQSADGRVRRWLLIDAHQGALLDQFSGIYELERAVAEGALGNVVWDEGQGHPEPIPSGWQGGNSGQVQAWNDEITGAKEAYNLFGSLTNGGWLSYDAQEATMRTVNNDPTISCPNANWNGTSANYCNGVTADDIVVHEWAHAYTEYSSELIYAWQPGALNEAFSDIWGETADLINGRGGDVHAVRSTASCSIYSGVGGGDNSTRWLVGEDAASFGGAIRDMWNPLCYENPGKVSDSDYHCATSDSGGVHINSGVPNHLYALLVDGGVYNGRTISAIGLTRAAQLFWRTQTAYLTPVSDFSDLADGLTAACNDLIGQNLYTLSTAGAATWGTIAPDKISAETCATVATAIAAVELRTPPTQCNFQPLLEAGHPALCSASQQAVTLLAQTWENGLGAWQVGRTAVAAPGQFSIPNWMLVTTLPDHRSGKGLFAADPVDNGDQCNQLDESGIIYLQSPPIAMPSYATAPRLTFDHWMASELGYDGGLLRYRVNNGAWTVLPKNRFLFNGYNSNLATTAQSNTNPLAGLPAFTGADEGSVQGSWGTSQIDLSGLATPGSTIELRFDFGLDACTGLVGWYMDDVQLYTCATPNDVAIRQTAPTSALLPGQPVTLQIFVDNSGQAPTTHVVVADSLPATLSYVSSSQQGLTFNENGTPPNLRWQIDQIIEQTTGTLTVQAKVAATLNQDQSIVNQATVSADNDSNSANNSATSTLNVVVPRLGFAANTVETTEGDAAAVTVTLNQANPYADTVVSYSLVAESASAASDYRATSGDLTIPRGAQSAVLTIPTIDDSTREGDESFRVVLSNARGAQISSASATITIKDNDFPGVTITPLTGTTSEDGQVATFDIALKTQPANNVTLSATSSDPSEGAVSAALTFTPANWATAQRLTVTGVNDTVDDNAQTYTIVLQIASADAEYAGLSLPPLSLTNADNDVAALTLDVTALHAGSTVGQVVTYTYAVTNSGTVTVSQLGGEDTLFGELPFTPTVLMPGASATLLLTRTTVISDLVGGIEQHATVSGRSAGGHIVQAVVTPTVTLLDVGLQLTAAVEIAGLGDPCQGQSTLRVPVGTTLVYCYQAENTGELRLTPHTVVDSYWGVVATNADVALAADATLVFTTTEVITADATSLVLWTATVDYQPADGEPAISSPLQLKRSRKVTITVATDSEDTDGDTIPDNVEGAGDPDRDRLPNYRDIDADGDGLLDRDEVGANPNAPRDRNGNGIPDYLEFGAGQSELYLPLIRH